MAPWHQVAREAFQAELERFEAEGWFTFEGKDAAELGRRAARLVTSERSRPDQQGDAREDR